VLKELMREELNKGNYVIAGGDFNQVFSNIDTSGYPVLENNWEAGVIDVAEFGDDFQFVTDVSNPTCRSLVEVYADAQDKSPEAFQYYVIDGFIVSSNVKVQSLRTHNTVFQYSDHNPVSMDVILLPDD
jgi:endonuclease/exonuclease/phosphatase family metal-dependent hydrolase